MILSIGEILVDIFDDGNNKQTFPGGAPFNVACNIATFGGDVSFFGSVGNDDNGHFLIDFAKSKVSKSYIQVLPNRYTTQALVTLENGERSFRFVRDAGADYLLDLSYLKQIDLSNVNIVHLGSLMLSYVEGRKFFYEAIKQIRLYKKTLISFDVNYRDDIFSSQEEAKKTFLEAIKEADIIKFTSEELELLTSTKDIQKALSNILSPKQVAVVTLGSEGSLFYSKDIFVKVDTIKMTPIDTTGAGDAFYSYFLFEVDKGLDLTNVDQIKEALFKANVVGGLATQSKGAINVVPTTNELNKFLNR